MENSFTEWNLKFLKILRCYKFFRSAKNNPKGVNADNFSTKRNYMLTFCIRLIFPIYHEKDPQNSQILINYQQNEIVVHKDLPENI